MALQTVNHSASGNLTIDVTAGTEADVALFSDVLSLTVANLNDGDELAIRLKAFNGDRAVSLSGFDTINGFANPGTIGIANGATYLVVLFGSHGKTYLATPSIANEAPPVAAISEILPAGGVAGSLLGKASEIDFDIGWLDGLGVDPWDRPIEGYGESVTGGAGYDIVYIDSLADSGSGSLREALTSGSGNRIVKPDPGLQGDIKLLTQIEVQTKDNVTLDGEGRIRTIGERIRFQDCDNLLVRRWRTAPIFDGGGDASNADGLSFESLSTAVRPLHFAIIGNDIEGPNTDAAIDVVWNYGNDMFFTVAYNKFHRHWKTFLVDADGANEGGTYHCTFYRNWWLDNTDRQPYVQNALCHTFNNVIERYGEAGGGGGGQKTRGLGELLSEYNIAKPRSNGERVAYDDILVTNPRGTWSGPVVPGALIKHVGTVLLRCDDDTKIASESDDTPGDVFSPTYAYTLDPEPDMQQIRREAGCGPAAARRVNTLSRLWSALQANNLLASDSAPPTGETSERPELGHREIGEPFFDRTLGKPIYWNGAAWVDANGTAV